MGALTVWEKLAPSAPEPSEDAYVRLDAVLPTQRCARLREFYDSSPFYSDALAEEDWAFPSQRYLDSGEATYGAHVATCDVHAIELGAYGVAAYHETPATLVTRGRERQQPVGRPRRVLVHVNDPLPDGCDAADLGLRLGLEAPPHSFSDAILLFQGPGIEELSVAQRRRLLGAASVSGCLTALGPLDERARQAWWQMPARKPPSPEEFVRLRADEGASYDEILVLNAARLEPLAFEPRSGLVLPAARVARVPIRRVAFGGCVGGDLESLQAAMALLERFPPMEGVDVCIVPASQRVLRQAQAFGLDQRAAALGAAIVAPSMVPAPLDASTNTCLGSPSLVLGPSTIVLAAHRGGLVPGGAT